MKRLTNILIHGKLALAFFLSCALLATASVPLIGAPFVERALLSSPPEMASITVMAETTSIATRAGGDVGGQVTAELT